MCGKIYGNNSVCEYTSLTYVYFNFCIQRTGINQKSVYCNWWITNYESSRQHIAQSSATADSSRWRLYVSDSSAAHSCSCIPYIYIFFFLYPPCTTEDLYFLQINFILLILFKIGIKCKYFVPKNIIIIN